MYKPPSPSNLYKQRLQIEKDSRTIIWLTGCLYKNKRVRTTSKSIAEDFKKEGWSVTELEENLGYWISWPEEYQIDS